MAKDPDIYRKLVAVLKKFPLEIDYKPSCTGPNISNRNLAGAYFGDNVKQRINLKSLPTTNAEIAKFADFIQDRFLPKMLPIMSRVFMRDLETLIMLRSSHYVLSNCVEWDSLNFVKHPKPKTIIPINIPVGNLPPPSPDCTDFELAIYCERRAIRAVIDMCLITKSENCYSAAELTEDLLRKDKLNQAIAVEPYISLIDQFKTITSYSFIWNRMLKTAVPIAEQFARDSAEASRLPLKNEELMPYIRLIMVLKAHPATFNRSDFSIEDFRSAIIDANFSGNKKFEHKLPTVRTLTPWFSAIWGSKVGSKPRVKSESGEMAECYMTWPWDEPHDEAKKDYNKALKAALVAQSYGKLFWSDRINHWLIRQPSRRYTPEMNKKIRKSVGKLMSSI